jgi:Heparinase II/III-like protein/Heparinase II/III N-terminus
VSRVGDGLDVVVASWRTYRARGIARRAIYELERRTGRLDRRATHTERRALNLELDLDTARIRSWYECNGDVGRDAAQPADTLLEGRVELYGGTASTVSWPPSWHRHPATGLALPTSVSSKLTDTGALGDVKDPWELARLCWIARLLRASTGSGDASYGSALRVAVHSFRDACPPGRGVQWMNGQEIAIRGIMLLFSWGVLTPGERTPELIDDLDAILVPSVARVAATIRYAASQRNNHYVTEAAFLWTAAAAAPGLEDRERVLARATSALSEAVRDQFGEDGAYSQHSFTYQRLALHALLWVSTVARSMGIDPPLPLQGVFERSYRLLAGVVDPESGRAPNFGANDGALLFALSSRPIDDFRPLLVHLALEAGLAPAVAEGAWDEEAAWFGHDSTTTRADGPPGRPAVRSAYHVLRGPGSLGFMHAGQHHHRPGHADQLNVDLWIRGANVARDLGTYRYTAPDPWRNALAGDDVHNVAVVDGATEARRVGRFFWLDWPQGSVLARAIAEDAEALVAEVPLVGVRHASARRLLARLGDHYVVVDRCRPRGGTVRWNLPEEAAVTAGTERVDARGEAWWLQCSGGPGGGLLEPRSMASPGSGWESRTYGELQPVVVVTQRTDDAGLVVSCFGPTGGVVPDAEVLGRFRAAALDPTPATLAHALRRWVDAA